MKILIHGLNFSPELIGIGKYTGELALWLAQSGHEVHIVTAPPYYPDWKVQPPYKSWRYQKEIWQNVQIVRCPIWVPSKVSGLTRIIHLLTFAISSFFALLNQIKTKPDVVISIIPTLFAAPSAAWIARRSKAVSWLHIQDFELDAATNLGILNSNNIIMRLTKKWEKSVLNRFDRVSSISTQMIKRLISKGVSEEKTILFPNWVDTEKIFPNSLNPNPYRTQLGIKEGQIVVLYSGNMGAKQGLDLVIEVARQLQKDSRIIFVLCGNGSSRIELEKQANTLLNLKFLDIQPPDKINLLLNSADIHILPQQAGAADFVMPSKLLGMLASGKPVITTADNNTELANIVAQVGLVVPPNDLLATNDAILKLVESKELRIKLGKKGREYVCNNWSQEKVLLDFLSQIKNL